MWNDNSSYYLYCVQLLEHFVEEYFDQNPISQLGVMVTTNKRTDKVTELGGK
jgi:transcription initiation factor TFIIH subunit 2